MIYHVSPSKIEKITDDGLFGHGLFFADCECKAGDYAYSLDELELKVIRASSLYYNVDETADTDIAAFTKKYGLELDVAFDAICERNVNLYDLLNPDEAGDAGFEIQRLALVLAEKLGFDAVQLFDENGTVWLVDGHAAQKKWREI